MSAAFMICKALLERCPIDEQSSLLALLPNEARKELEQLPSASLPQPNGKIPDPLSHIHPSWLAPFLRTLPKHDLKIFLSALSKAFQEPLMHELGFSEPLPTLSKWGKEFARKCMVSQLLKGAEILFPPFTPSSPIRGLVKMTQPKLLAVMQYLGLYDLSIEVRQIIDKKQLNKILSSLSEEETHFLQGLSQQHDLVVFKRLFLQGWDGKRATLTHLLQERGMQRLAFALYGQDKSLIWIVAHSLEQKMGAQLLKLIVKPREMRVCRTMMEQVGAVITTLGAK